MASPLQRLLRRARVLTAEREQLIAQIAEEWSAALRGQPLSKEDLGQLWDGLAEEAVRCIQRRAKGRWSAKAIQEAASQVVLSIRERVQRDLEQLKRSASDDPSAGRE